MEKLPPISALEAFEAVARAASVKQAANDLNLTPGAVSRQIQTLEERLGVELFRRSHRKVTLTAAGTAYLAEIRPALSILRTAGQQVRSLAQSRPIKVITYPTVAIRWLLPRWARFVSSHPDIDVQLVTATTAADFTNGDGDLWICVPEPGMLTTITSHWRLLEVQPYPVASPDVAARLRRPRDLAAETLLNAATRPRDWEHWLQVAGASNLKPVRTLRFESLNLAIQAAIEGLGIVMAFDALVADDMEAGRLARPFAQAHANSRPLYLFQRTLPSQSEKVSIMRDWLLSQA
ncbi:MAG: LysR family transcriptional regulator [Alphaproteobacteria bacterium]|nr:LysR family transcriptional regulator [Alphaproteobacteria bacterium]MCB9928684.1 LysR family transcriptional regulator [Alphaproteobacteria bacterium]